MIAGKAGSGKDTAADYLRDLYSYNKLAFADTLKDFVAQKYSINKELMYSQHGKRTVINGITVRELLIKEANAKKNDYPNFWIDQLLHKISILKSRMFRKFVISDFRFINEFNELNILDDTNITTILIDRNDNVGKYINDPSETSLDDFQFNFIVKNNSTIDEFYSLLDSIARQL